MKVVININPTPPNMDSDYNAESYPVSGVYKNNGGYFFVDKGTGIVQYMSIMQFENCVKSFDTTEEYVVTADVPPKPAVDTLTIDSVIRILEVTHGRLPKLGEVGGRG